MTDESRPKSAKERKEIQRKRDKDDKIAQVNLRVPIADKEKLKIYALELLEAAKQRQNK